MNSIRLYLDEDSMSNRLLQALRQKSIDIISVNEAKTQGYSDEQQLIWARDHQRVLYSHNVGDFYQLHSQWLQKNQNHSGILLLSQGFTIGDRIRAITQLMAQVTMDNMANLVCISASVYFMNLSAKYPTMINTSPWDAAHHLQTKDAIIAYLEAALEDSDACLI